MELIAINFVLEFARDLQKLLESLDKEYGNLLVNGSAYYKKRIQKRASELTEELYEKYIEILDLQLEQGEEGSNIVLKNYDNEEYLIPYEFIKGSKFYELQEKFEFFLFTFEIGKSSWSEFSFRLTLLFASYITKLKLIKYKNLEKIRFFMEFIKINPYFDYENIPSDPQTIHYKPKYDKWRKNSSFTKLYNKYIKSDKYFFQKRVNVFPIPNYPHWNLQMTFLDLLEEEKYNEFKRHNYYPIQVFEDLKGSISEIIALETKDNLIGNKIKKVSMINNFNQFPSRKNKSKSFIPENESIYNSYTKFLDEMESGGDDSFYNVNTFESTIDFSFLSKNEEYIIPYLKKKTINEFNLLYDRNLSKFAFHFLSDTNKLRPTYRYLFASHYIFPDFNFNGNFLLIIKKKRRNSKFENLIHFLKNWSHQTIVYELKDKIILNGLLLPNFNMKYSKELVDLNDLFDSENIEYKFKISKQDYKYSNLSIYALPSSNQYVEEENRWKLDKLEIPISINNKEIHIGNQTRKEKVLYSMYQ